MKTLFINLLFAVFTFTPLTVEDVIDQASAHFKTGDAKELALLFTATVDLTVLETEDAYSKAQAEIILKKFFTEHPAKDFEIAHRGESANKQYCIGNLTTEKGDFRVSFYIKSENGSNLINSLTIEEE